MKRAIKSGKKREFQIAQIQKIRESLAAEFMQSAPAVMQKFNSKSAEKKHEQAGQNRTSTQGRQRQYSTQG